MHRRSLLAGLLFAPAIIRTPGLLMPIKRLAPAINGLLTPELVASEMMAIMARAITQEQMGRLMDGDAMRTSLNENGAIEVRFIPGSEIYREFYG